MVSWEGRREGSGWHPLALRWKKNPRPSAFPQEKLFPLSPSPSSGSLSPIRPRRFSVGMRSRRSSIVVVEGKGDKKERKTDSLSPKRLFSSCRGEKGKIVCFHSSRLLPFFVGGGVVVLGLHFRDCLCAAGRVHPPP